MGSSCCVDAAWSKPSLARTPFTRPFVTGSLVENESVRRERSSWVELEARLAARLERMALWRLKSSESLQRAQMRSAGARWMVGRGTDMAASPRELRAWEERGRRPNSTSPAVYLQFEWTASSAR
jgi:hypothetical protein